MNACLGEISFKYESMGDMTLAHKANFTHENRFEARCSHTTTNICNSELVIFGGGKLIAGDNNFRWMKNRVWKHFNDLWKFNSITNKLIEVIPRNNSASILPVDGLRGHTTQYDNATNSLYVFGGTSPTKVCSNKTFSFCLTDSTWREVVLENPPSARRGAASWMYKGVFFVHGGVNDDLERERGVVGETGKIYWIDFKSRSWMSCSPNCSHENENERCDISFCTPQVIGSTVYFFSGVNQYNGYQEGCKTLELNCEDGIFCFKYLKAAAETPHKRFCHASCAVGKFVIIAGGQYEDKVFNDIWALDTVTGQYTEIILKEEYQRRNGHTLNILGNEIIMIGGGEFLGNYYNDIDSFLVENFIPLANILLEVRSFSFTDLIEPEGEGELVTINKSVTTKENLIANSSYFEAQLGENRFIDSDERVFNFSEFKDEYVQVVLNIMKRKTDRNNWLKPIFAEQDDFVECFGHVNAIIELCNFWGVKRADELTERYCIELLVGKEGGEEMAGYCAQLADMANYPKLKEVACYYLKHF